MQGEGVNICLTLKDRESQLNRRGPKKIIENAAPSVHIGGAGQRKRS